MSVARISICGIAVAVLAVACTSSPGTGGAGGSVDRDAVLRIGYAGPTQSLDPAKQGIGGSQPSTFLIYDRLTQIDNDLRVKPMLAASWEFAPNGSYLDMKLREGVTFHDGTPVDAAAVKANLDRGKSLPGSTVAPTLAAITSVNVVDPLTVRLNLAPSSGADLPTVLASNAGEIISPRALADGRDLGNAPGDAGSGPYVVAEYRPNEIVAFERATGQYWDTEAAKPKRVEIVYSPQGSTRLNALRAGQFDVAQLTGPDVQTAERLAESGAFATSRAPILTPYSLFIRSSAPPFADPRVRQAISMAIDRKAISESLLSGDCEPRVQPYPKGHWAHVDGLEEKSAGTPEKARQLLAQLGGNVVNFQLAFTAGSSFEPIAQAIQSQLAAVGIKVELAPLPSAAAFAGYREGRYPAYLGASPIDAEPAQLLKTAYLGGFNAGEAVRATITPLANQANNPTLSQEQRGTLYGRIWTEVAGQASLINICASTQLWAYSPKVTGIDQMPWRWSGLLDARYLAVTH